MRVLLVFAACASILSGCRQRRCLRPLLRTTGSRRRSWLLPARPQLMFVSVAVDDSTSIVGGVAEALDRGCYITPLACDRSLCRVARDLPGNGSRGNSALHIAPSSTSSFSRPACRQRSAEPRANSSMDAGRPQRCSSGHPTRSSFSTKTTVIDPSDGRVIRDPEEFAVEGRQRITKKTSTGLTFTQDGNSSTRRSRPAASVTW